MTTELSNLTTRVVRKIEEIPPRDWNSVFPRVLENYYFFKTLDESGFAQFSFFYIMVYDRERPVGATSCFLMNFPLDIAVQGPLKAVYNYVNRVLPNILSPRVLMCGLPMSQGRIGIAADSGPLLEAICGSMEKIAKENKAAMLIFKDFTGAYDDFLKPLSRKGFIKIESLPSTDMDIPFASFDEFLKSLSRVSRDGLKRKFKKIDGRIKVDLEITGALDDKILPRVYELYLQTFERMDLGLEKVPMDFFKQISRNMPEETKFFLWSIEGRIVAFAYCLVLEGYFIDYYLGFDYSVAYEYHLYFVRFRDLMKFCIAHGIKKYEMGVTSYEAKRRLGFDFIPLYFYMKHRNPLLNPFVKVVSHFMKPENFDPVFKDMKRNKNRAGYIN
jgi:predicted N-acyltransferase